MDQELGEGEHQRLVMISWYVVGLMIGLPVVFVCLCFSFFNSWKGLGCFAVGDFFLGLFAVDFNFPTFFFPE